MEFWLKNEKENINLLLPITPSEYSIPEELVIETINLTKAGDINVPTFSRLKTVTIEGIFTVEKYSFVNKKTYNASNAIDYVNLIKKWKNNKSIIRLIIANKVSTKCNSLFYIESIKYSQNDGTDDINYSITLRGYKKLNVAKGNKSTSSTKRPTTTAPKTNGRTYTVKSGDCLWNIALKFYGNGNLYTKIYNANKSKIKNPSLIYKGQVLTIP